MFGGLADSIEEVTPDNHGIALSRFAIRCFFCTA